jgi:hypothetical protein
MFAVKIEIEASARDPGDTQNIGYTQFIETIFREQMLSCVQDCLPHVALLRLIPDIVEVVTPS